MKILKYILSIVGVFLVLSVNVYSCEMNIEVINGKKVVYAKNDEIVVKVKVVLNHRNCPEDINKVQLNTSGADIVSATKWKEASSGVWERKLKVKINSPKNGKATINAVRTCKKDGGSATLTLTAK